MATDTVDGPMVVDTQNVLHRVWAEDGDIFYQTYAPDGNWSVPHNVSNTLTPAEGPLIELDEQGGVHVIWRDLDGPNNYGVYYAARSSAGWSAPVNVTRVELNAGGYYLLKTEPDGTPHVIWEQHGQWRYYYTTQDASGQWLPSELGGEKLSVSKRGDAHVVDPRDATHNWRYQGVKWGAQPVPLQSFNAFGLTLLSDHNSRLLALWRFQNDLYYAESYPIEVDSVSPSAITNFVTPRLEITGTGFVPTPRLLLGEIELQNVELTSATRLRADLPDYLEPGDYELAIENPDGAKIIFRRPISVTSPLLSITSVEPAELLNFLSTELTILGTGFIPNPEVYLGEIQLPAPIIVS